MLVIAIRLLIQQQSGITYITGRYAAAALAEAAPAGCQAAGADAHYLAIADYIQSIEVNAIKKTAGKS